MTGLLVRSAGPGVTVQDFGRPGWLARGLSRGGAMDRDALWEGAALLGHDPEAAALEMAGMGGVFEATGDLTVALTGAPMSARIDGANVPWMASHGLRKGQVLEIGGVRAGVYGYLSLSGGIAGRDRLGASATHLVAGIGQPVAAGEHLQAGAPGPADAARGLPLPDRFSGGRLRILPTAQTHLFDRATRDRLAETAFTRDPRSNRMAGRLAFEGAGFTLEGGLSVLSEITQPGDIQITGDGTPVILMAEAQTTGGYPRIATILPADLPRAAQCPAGKPLSLTWIDRNAALAAERAAAEARIALAKAVQPLIRDPHMMSDLLSYSLIDGMITGKEAER